MSTPATERDLAVLAHHLGREPRGVVDIAARCVCGNPTVVRTAPRLPDGTPFPTLFYLTHPGAVKAVSTLEAAGVMRDLQDWVTNDAEVSEAYRRAHEQYLAERRDIQDVAEIGGISAGGMPDRVKCLHVVVGHSLAAGPGVNPVGDRALDMIAAQWSPARCTCSPVEDLTV